MVALRYFLMDSKHPAAGSAAASVASAASAASAAAAALAAASAASASVTPAVPTPPKELEQREQGDDRRRTVVDRRMGLERRSRSREESGYSGLERRVASSDRRD